MLEQQFIKISAAYNSTLDVNHFTVNGNMGAKVSISIYTLPLILHGVTVTIKYELGNFNLAEIGFSIQTERKFSDFQLQTKDHFSRLFSFNKDPWRIKGADKFFISKIEHGLQQSGFTQLATKTAFEPSISGRYENGTYLVKTRFSLAFENKEDSVVPLIDFQKKMIELLIL